MQLSFLVCWRPKSVNSFDWVAVAGSKKFILVFSCEDLIVLILKLGPGL